MTLDQLPRTAKVLIEVSGGIVQAVYADAPIEVCLVDWDNITTGDPRPEQIQFEDGTTAERFMADAQVWL